MTFRYLMDENLVSHLSQGHHIPGIITLNAEMTIGDTIAELILIAEVGFPDEYEDRIVHLPAP
jgi:hypothetical protein